MSRMSRPSVDSGQILDQPPAETDGQVQPTTTAEVVFKGRNVEIPDHYRVYVSQKLARLERFDRSIYLFDVELKHAPNRRQRKSCQRVEITARGRGPVTRAEACADSFYAAFESAVDKLENRLRRVKDRRKVHYGDKTPVSLAAATAAGSPAVFVVVAAAAAGTAGVAGFSYCGSMPAAMYNFRSSGLRSSSRGNSS